MPAKIVGEINWLLQPNYPKSSGEEEAETIEVKYIAGNDLLPTVLPDYGTTFNDYRWPFYSAMDHLTLSSRTVTAMEGCYTYFVELTYTVPPKMLEVSYQSPSFTVPIEQHPNYRTSWNYLLLAKDGVQQSPSWWVEEKTTKINEADSKNYAWAKAGDKVPDGWYTLKDLEKPGVEIFQTSVPIVTVRRLSLYEDDLEKIAGKDNTQQNPPETYGYTGEWLQSNSSMSKEGRFYVLTTVYKGSKDIDDDIYGPSAPAPLLG